MGPLRTQDPHQAARRMKAAFATWHDRIAPLFDTCRHLYVVEVAPGGVPIGRRLNFEDRSPVQKVLGLVDMDIFTLVCGAISRPLHAIALAHDIQVYSFVAGNLEDVLQAWIAGRLPETAFAMPGHGGRSGVDGV